MSGDLDNKLALLREQYKKTFPEKMNELNICWNNVLDKPGPDSLNLFYRMVHNLHGSAGMYGYSSLSDVASRLESLINTFMDDPKLITDNKNRVITLLNECQSILLKEAGNVPIH